MERLPVDVRRFTRLQPLLSMQGRAKARVGGRPLEALEVLVRIGAEVEVELGDPLLDDAPHRLAEVRHEAHPHERVAVAAPVSGEELALADVVELVVDGEVAEVDEVTAPTRVLPIHVQETG